MTFKIHVQLAAPEGCEEKARTFYGDILGLEEIPKPAELRKRGGCWFLCGSQEIHIGVEQNFSSAKKAHPARPDVTRFYALDPFGNRIEFMERKNG
ncbi:glyoxalase [Bacillus thuringiensis]